MTILLVVRLLLLIAGGFFWWLIQRSKNLQNLVETTGENGYRRIVIKRLIRYTYRYTVNGRTYKLRGELFGPLRRPWGEGRIVYLRGFPSLSYLEKFTAQRELLWALFLTFVGIFALVLFVVFALV